MHRCDVKLKLYWQTIIYIKCEFCSAFTNPTSANACSWVDTLLPCCWYRFLWLSKGPVEAMLQRWWFLSQGEECFNPVFGGDGVGWGEGMKKGPLFWICLLQLLIILTLKHLAYIKNDWLYQSQSLVEADQEEVRPDLSLFRRCSK